jgi:hypothetical protein
LTVSPFALPVSEAGSVSGTGARAGSSVSALTQPAEIAMRPTTATTRPPRRAELNGVRETRLKRSMPARKAAGAQRSSKGL